MHVRSRRQLARTPYGKSFTVLEAFEIGMIAHWGICGDTDPNVALSVHQYGHHVQARLAAFGCGTEITKDIPGVGAVLGGEETFGLLELTVTISARLTGNLDNTKLNIGFDICVEEIEGAIKQCMSEIPLYGDKWWPILIPPSGAGMSFTSACSATRRLEEEQRDEERRLEEERRELKLQYAKDQFQESKGCAKDLKVSKVVVHDKYTVAPLANDIALLWLAEDVPDCLIETGETRDHCETPPIVLNGPPVEAGCWPRR